VEVNILWILNLINMSHYDTNLDKNDANYVPLSPLSFLERTKDIYPNYEAIVYESRSYTWAEVYKRCVKFASALEKIGIKTGDTVSIMAFNTPEIFEAHYSIPMVGAVINAINTRLDPKTISYILEHSDAKVLIADRQFHEVITKALKNVKTKIIIIDIDDKDANLTDSKKIGEHEYEQFLNTGDENYKWKKPKDEWQAISLGYTSGTTGNPKGVVYHHRGAYLMATGSATAWNMPNKLNFLYTVPMFHCNGWCYPWTLSMLHGRVICLRNIDVKKIFELIDKYDVTHFGGAPIVLNMLANAPKEHQKKLKRKIHVLTAGAPPPSIIFEKMQNLGFDVMHVYGLTETSPVVSCNPIHKIKVETVGPPFKGNQVKIAEDGEILVKGENVMLGYWNNKEDTEKVIKDGWLYTGDIGEIDPEDGYLKITDRKKDIIVSAGGDNISPAKIENQLSNSPAIDQCMVWGDGKNYLVALIVPSKEFKEQKEKISKIINKINENLAQIEKIKNFHLVSENFSIENGMLTPTMKVKRNKVIAKYKNILENFYKK